MVTGPQSGPQPSRGPRATDTPTGGPSCGASSARARLRAHLLNDNGQHILDLFKAPLPISAQVALDTLFRRDSSVLEGDLLSLMTLPTESLAHLVHSGWASVLVQNIGKLEESSQKQLLARMIEGGAGEVVLSHRSRFENISDDELSDILIGAQRGRTLVENLAALPNLDHNQLVMKLVAARQADALHGHFDRLKGLNKEVALTLIEEGHPSLVAKSYRSFPEWHDMEVLRALAARGFTDISLSMWLPAGTSTPESKLMAVRALVRMGFAKSLLPSRSVVVGDRVSEDAWACLFIQEGQARVLADNLGRSESGLRNLSLEVAVALIAEGYATSVARAITAFVERERVNIAYLLVLTGNGEALADHFRAFDVPDQKVLADALIEGGQGEALARNIHHFKENVHAEISRALVGANALSSVVNNWGRFSGLDWDVALYLIGLGIEIRWLPSSGYGTFIKKFEKRVRRSSFEECNNELAERMISKGLGSFVVTQLAHFTELGPQVREWLIAQGHGEKIKQNPQAFLSPSEP